MATNDFIMLNNSNYISRISFNIAHIYNTAEIYCKLHTLQPSKLENPYNFQR